MHGSPYWIFATYDSLESCLRPTETNWDFSEMHMNCFHDFDTGPCAGGNWRMATAYLARWDGPADESCCPYTLSGCPAPPACGIRKHVQNVLFLPARTGMTDNDSIKSAIVTHGAVATSMYWDSYYYNPARKAYRYSIIGTTPNHAVCIVGWDDDFDRLNFTDPPPSNGAFIARDSRGTSFGESGYFHVSYHDANIGGDNAVFIKSEPTSNYNRVYQYDTYGWTGTPLGNQTETGWFANIFTAQENEQLAAVAFYTLAANSSFELYTYTGLGSSTATLPTSGTQAAYQYGTINGMGYHTIPMNPPVSVVSGQRFSVVVRLTTQGCKTPICIERPVDNYCSAAIAHAGESWRKYDGQSWMELHASTYYPNTNVCLKAFTASPLPIPTNVQASINLVDKVEVSWDAVAEATGYKVFRHTENSSSQASEIGSCAASPYSDTTASPGTDYYYGTFAGSTSIMA